MSKLSELRQREQSQRAANPRSGSNFVAEENFVLEKVSYDLEAGKYIGIRMDTGERVSVVMRPDPKAAQRSTARAEIDYHAKKYAEKLEPFFCIERARRMEDGNYTAGWIVPGGVKAPNRKITGEAFMGYARIAPSLKRVDLIEADQAVVLAGEPETVLATLQAALAESDITAVILRVCEPASGEVISFPIYGQSIDFKTNTVKTSAADRIDMLRKDPFYETLLAGLEHEDLLVEAIPSRSIFMGPKAAANLINYKDTPRDLSAAFRTEEGKNGFVKASLLFHHYYNDEDQESKEDIYCTRVIAQSLKQPVLGLAEVGERVDTPNFSPKAVAETSKDVAAAASEPADSNGAEAEADDYVPGDIDDYQPPVDDFEAIADDFETMVASTPRRARP